MDIMEINTDRYFDNMFESYHDEKPWIQNILITGAAGSVGSALVKFYSEQDDFHVIAFDNNDYGLWKLRQCIKNDNVSYVLGDVRLEDNIKSVFNSDKYPHIVIHCSAYKNLDNTEFNPISTIENDLIGTINIVNESIAHGIEKFLFISSDKAVAATSLMGSCKFASEQITLWANKQRKSSIFSCVRFANIVETAGNTFEKWRLQELLGEKFTITDWQMKRYFVTIEQIVKFIDDVIIDMEGGEIFLPYVEKQTTLREKFVELYGEDAEYELIGKRQGEKMEDELFDPRIERLVPDENKKYFIIEKI